MVELQIGTHLISLEEKVGKLFLGDKEVDVEWKQEKERLYKVKYDSITYMVVVHQIDSEKNEVDLQINGKRGIVKVQSRMEKLLKELGMTQSAEKKLDSLTAPMPGLIKQIHVQEGDQVSEGDALVILEAMKMENVIKATGEGTVLEVVVKENASVEKDALLLRFS